MTKPPTKPPTSRSEFSALPNKLREFYERNEYGSFPELDLDVRDRHGKVVANYHDHERHHVFNLYHTVRDGEWWAVGLMTHGRYPNPRRYDRSRRIAELLFGPPLEERPDPRGYGPRMIYRGDPRQHQHYDVITRRCIPPIWPLDVTLPAELMALVLRLRLEQPRRTVNKVLSPRTEAKRVGAKRFFGKICSKHPNLKGDRYTSSGVCTKCLKVAASKRLEADIRRRCQLLEVPKPAE